MRKISTCIFSFSIAIASLFSISKNLSAAEASEGKGAKTLVQEQWPNAQFQMSDADLQSLYNIMDKGSEDPYIYWLFTRSHNRLVRSELEFEVAEVLDNHPVAVKIRKKIAKDLDDAILEYRVQHLGGAAKAYDVESEPGKNDTQYGEFLKVTRDLAQAMGFPAEARKGAEIFFLGSSQVNAYTFSARQSKIIAAIYSGLWELFDKNLDVLRPVMAHELQHIMARHIAMRAELIAIFISTAIDLIPDVDSEISSKDEDTREAAKAKLQASLLKGGFADLAPVIMSAKKLGAEILEEPLVKAAIIKSLEKQGFALNSHEAHQITAEYAEKVGSGFANRLLEIALQLRQDVTRAERLDVTAKLMKTVGERTKKSADGENEEPAVDMKALKKFMQKVDGIWSRSNEKTCDHMARALSATSRIAAEPFVRMMGGKWASYDGMIRQSKELAQERTVSPEFAVEEGSHPDIGERIKYMDQYAQTDGFKIVSDPFLKAVHFYLLLSQEITEKEQAAKTDRKGAVVMGLADYQAGKAKAFASELGTWLRAELVGEYKKALGSLATAKSVEDLAKVEPLLKKYQTFLDILSSGSDSFYFDYYFHSGANRRNVTWSDWMKTMSRPNRLPHDLKSELKTEKARIEKELAALLNPPPSTPKSGKASTKASSEVSATGLRLQLALVTNLIAKLEELLPYESQSTGQRFRNDLLQECGEILAEGAEGQG